MEKMKESLGFGATARKIISSDDSGFPKSAYSIFLKAAAHRRTLRLLKGIDSVIIKLIFNDPFRMKVLEQVRSLSLPDCWVAAGFIRNMAWDVLHNQPKSALNDIDVIYYDPTDENHSLGGCAREKLNSMDPSVNWEVKNQAFMHLRNGDSPYKSSKHAMSFWHEKETAVGAKMKTDGSLAISAPFGTSSLLAGLISHNPMRDLETFNHRVQLKGWLSKWPHLRVVPQQDGCA